MFKSHQIKSYHRVLRKNKVDTNGISVFARDIAAKMCINSNEHSMYIRCLCSWPAGQMSKCACFNS
jgi:hypothetical protein